MIRFLFLFTSSVVFFAASALATEPKLKLELKGTCEYRLRASDYRPPLGTSGYVMNEPFPEFLLSTEGQNMVVLRSQFSPESPIFFVSLTKDQPFWADDGTYLGETYSLLAIRGVDPKDSHVKIMGSTWTLLKIKVFADGTKMVALPSGGEHWLLEGSSHRIHFSLEYEVKRSFFQSEKVKVEMSVLFESNQPKLEQP